MRVHDNALCGSPCLARTPSLSRGRAWLHLRFPPACSSSIARHLSRHQQLHRHSHAGVCHAGRPQVHKVRSEVQTRSCTARCCGSWRGLACSRLTIRSSRCRFAARLSSGVRRQRPASVTKVLGASQHRLYRECQRRVMHPASFPPSAFCTVVRLLCLLRARLHGHRITLPPL